MNRVQRSFAQFLFIALLLTLLLAACGGRNEPPTPTPEPVTLTFITLDEDSAAEAAAIERFETEHSHIRIERQGYNRFPQQYLTSDQPPDIMTIGPSNILLSAGKQGLLIDLSDLWQQSDLYADYPENFQQMGEVDGKQFFLPMAYSWAGFYYNPTIFDELGLMPPQSWDEFMLVADTLLSAGVTPMALAGQSPFSSALWFDYLNLRLNGPDFHQGLIRGEESYLDDRVRAVFEVWDYLIEGGYFLPGIGDTNDFEALATLIEGPGGPLTSNQAGMVLADPLAMVELPENLRNQPGFFRFPIIDPSQPVGESLLVLGYMIPSGAEHVDEAIEFLRYMGQAEVQEQLFQPSEQNLSYAPVRVTDSSDYSEEIRRRMDVVLDADQVQAPYFLGNPTSMEMAIETTLGQFLDQAEQGTANIDDVIIQLEAAREQARAQGEFVE